MNARPHDLRFVSSLPSFGGGALLSTVVLLAAACGNSDEQPVTPSDDPADYTVDTSVEYSISVSELRWQVPSTRLPEEVGFAPANNNLDIIFHEGRLYLGWRQAEDHWASADAKMHIVSSADGGETWAYEASVERMRDVREPRFLSINGELHMYFFEGGVDFFSFEPLAMLRMTRRGPGDWTDAVQVGRPGEVPWDLKVRNGVAYLTSYSGEHYGIEEADVAVFFQRSTDGVNWSPVNPDREVSYRGGNSEVAFELTESGDAWFVTRNEDGDETGFGSQLCFAAASDLAAWQCPERSDPERYDSPEMFRHGDDLYLVARRDIGGPFDQGLTGVPIEDLRLKYQADYWTRPKRTAIYRVNTVDRRIEHIVDLPSAGDTAFPAIRRTGPNTFLLANYTSPLDAPDIAWVEGQGSERGTQIYFVELTFQPQ